jgi:hypothetical protein
MLKTDMHPDTTCGSCRLCCRRRGRRKGDHHVRDVTNSNRMIQRRTL